MFVDDKKVVKLINTEYFLLHRLILNLNLCFLVLVRSDFILIFVINHEPPCFLVLILYKYNQIILTYPQLF
jgi:hypothetical protein